MEIHPRWLDGQIIQNNTRKQQKFDLLFPSPTIDLGDGYRLVWVDNKPPFYDLHSHRIGLIIFDGLHYRSVKVRGRKVSWDDAPLSIIFSEFKIGEVPTADDLGEAYLSIMVIEELDYDLT